MLFQAKHFNLLDNMCLNIGKIVAEKTFHLYAVRAPRLWENGHFVICNGVLHRIKNINLSFELQIVTYLNKLLHAVILRRFLRWWKEESRESWSQTGNHVKIVNDSQ